MRPLLAARPQGRNALQLPEASLPPSQAQKPIRRSGPSLDIRALLPWRAGAGAKHFLEENGEREDSSQMKGQPLTTDPIHWEELPSRSHTALGSTPSWRQNYT